MIALLEKILTREQVIPDEYKRMLRNEFRNVPLAYVESFVKIHNRLPTLKELANVA